MNFRSLNVCKHFGTKTEQINNEFESFSDVCQLKTLESISSLFLFFALNVENNKY